MLTRRDFVAKLAVTGAAIGAFALAPEAAWTAEASASRAQAREPVVSFHMDRPYIDPTGTAMPYLPPAARVPARPLRDSAKRHFAACSVTLESRRTWRKQR